MTFEPAVLAFLILCFLWSGFVRTGFGFGASSLMLPFALLVLPDPLILVPLIVTQDMLFISHVIVKHFHNIAWRKVFSILAVFTLPFFAGVYGLISLPSKFLTLAVYCIAILYASSYIFDVRLKSKNNWTDTIAIIMTGYTSGLSYTGGPVIASVIMKHISKEKVRDSLLGMFIIIAAAKLITLVVAGVSLNLSWQIWFLPAVAIGHFLGLAFHNRLVQMQNKKFYRILGVILLTVSLIGITKITYGF